MCFTGNFVWDEKVTAIITQCEQYEKNKNHTVYLEMRQGTQERILL